MGPDPNSCLAGYAPHVCSQQEGRGRSGRRGRRGRSGRSAPCCGRPRSKRLGNDAALRLEVDLRRHETRGRRSGNLQVRGCGGAPGPRLPQRAPARPSMLTAAGGALFMQGARRPCARRPAAARRLNVRLETVAPSPAQPGAHSRHSHNRRGLSLSRRGGAHARKVGDGGGVGGGGGSGRGSDVAPDDSPRTDARGSQFFGRRLCNNVLQGRKESKMGSQFLFFLGKPDAHRHTHTYLCAHRREPERERVSAAPQVRTMKAVWSYLKVTG